VAIDELEPKWSFLEVDPQSKTRLAGTDNENI
jgi:hypothetical protein